FGPVARFLGQRLFRGEARLQDGGRARFGFGTLGGESFGATLRLEAALHLRRRLRLGALALFRRLERLAVGLGAGLRAAAPLGLGGEALRDLPCSALQRLGAAARGARRLLFRRRARERREPRHLGRGATLLRRRHRRRIGFLGRARALRGGFLAASALLR